LQPVLKNRLRVKAEYVEQKGIKPPIVGTMRKIDPNVQNGKKILVKGRKKWQISRQVISPNCIARIAKWQIIPRISVSRSKRTLRTYPQLQNQQQT
jgi:hypothetical protein